MLENNRFGETAKSLGVGSELQRLNTPHKSLLTPDQLDNLGLAVLSLAKELWVVKDRQLVAEALLKQNGLLADLDTFQPDADLAAKLSAERQRFMKDLMAALLETPSPNA